MANTEIFENLKTAIVELDEIKAETYAKEVISAGIDILESIDKGLSAGMKEIGDQFEKGICFLPELIQASETFNKAMDVLEPEILKRGGKQAFEGVVVIGTVKGDIHKVGKDILAMLMKVRGFEVHNIGEDVAMSTFLNKAEAYNADIIAMSSLLTTTMPAQKEIIEFLKEKNVRGNYITMVGGGVVNEKWAEEIGADGYADTAEQAVNLAIELIKAKRN